MPVSRSILTALFRPGSRSPVQSLEMNVSSHPRCSAASRCFRVESGHRRSIQSLSCSAPDCMGRFNHKQDTVSSSPRQSGGEKGDVLPSPYVVGIYRPMQANILIKQNVSALLRAQHKNAKDLALWCHKTESWLSKVLREPRREFSFKDLDRIADFFGYGTYHLLTPGIAGVAERRSGMDRRTVKERRFSPAQRGMLRVADELDSHRPQRKGASVAVASSPIELALKRLTADYEKRVTALLQAATHAGDEAPAPRRKIAAPHKRDRDAGGSDAGKA